MCEIVVKFLSHAKITRTRKCHGFSCLADALVSHRGCVTINYWRDWEHFESSILNESDSNTWSWSYSGDFYFEAFDFRSTF